MKKVIFQVAIVLMVLAVWSCTSGVKAPISGVIVDATMNTIVIKTADGDTVLVSTVDADVTADDGILIGDSVQAWIAEASNDTVLIANKVIVTSAPKATLEGSWVEPIPGMEDLMQGITLSDAGEASSINMATLQYSSWMQFGDSIVLLGKSIGNGQTIEFADTMRVEKLTIDSLVLTKGTIVFRYSKRQ